MTSPSTTVGLSYAFAKNPRQGRITSVNRRFTTFCSKTVRRILTGPGGLFAFLLLSFAFGASATADDVTIDGVGIGIHGWYRVGRLTQVVINLTSPTEYRDARLEVTLPDGEGISSTFVSTVTIQSGVNRLGTIAKTGRVDSSLLVRLLDGSGRVIANRVIPSDELPDAVQGSQNLVLTLGSDIGTSKALLSRREKAGQETIHGPIEDAGALPDHWLGYDGVSLVIMPASRAGLAPSMSDEQIEALAQWVRMGGRLLLSSGASSPEMIGNNGRLVRFAPGDFDRVMMQRQSNGLESFAGATKRSLSSYVADGELSFRIPMVSLKNVKGNILVSEGIGAERSPMIIRSSFGLGHVIFVATDIDQPPMSLWLDGRQNILDKLLDEALGETRREENDSQFANLTQIGFNDLTGQLRAAMDQFPGVRLVPFSWIAILVGLYIVLIGPVDYFMLRRMQSRFSLTWITFPTMVVLGCILAWWLTQHWKGQALRINQVDVVDIDSESGQMRTVTWAHLFSPKSRKHNLALENTNHVLKIAEPTGHVTSWQGLPGTSFGGMNNQRMNNTGIDYRFECDLDDDSNQSITVVGMPIDVFASRSLAGLSWGQVDLPAMPPLVADSDRQLIGTVRNPLPVALKGPRLCFGRWVYPLPTLAPEGSVQLDRFSKVKTIDGMLTKTQVDQDFKDRSQPWDRKSFDTNRIMEMMMLHKAAGGTKYTSLLHRFQGEIDFTDHLNQGHALLIGQTDDPQTRIIAPEKVQQSETQTWIRILLPVTMKERR